MYYIQESEKENLIFKLFNIIQLRDNRIILPIANNELKNKKAIKLAKKTNKLIKKTNCNKVVISKEIKEQVEYVNYIDSYGIKIVDGRKLFKNLSSNVLEYIIDKKNLTRNETMISILINDIGECELENIKYIIKNYKRLNIVTEHIEKFKRMEEEIKNEEGIILSISNNKRKSLLNS
ncbi:MAG: hypothetical protein HUJ68_04625, partial [Clostridia bacterium]|nr:hypothetical protein [Clostridia bacterium]